MGDSSGGFHGASFAVWFMTFVIIAGTIVGGIALIYWNWPLFWTGVGLFVGGCIGAYFTNIMGAVTEFGMSASNDSSS